MATWNIDISHSSINFRVRHMMFAKVRGHFNQWQGALNGTADDLGHGRAHVEIDAASIDTGTLDRDNHLRSADFLDVGNFPKLVFDTTGVRKDGEDLTILGNLTIRGTTRPVTLKAEHTGAGTDPWGNARLGFHATTRLSRKEFGLTWNQLLETGGAVVGDEIDVEIDVEVVQAKG